MTSREHPGVSGGPSRMALCPYPVNAHKIAPTKPLCPQLRALNERQLGDHNKLKIMPRNGLADDSNE